ncbi:hypothetical protein CTI12_AA058030 [Artemisia annua]|uniref:KIB1-4 beta-propeller domain-containing protein n=1 Tax=Artemisia annua TaxID=35608 RepID=A0A2U1Q9I3_ARTAN|nr:hypothetical protein CTI12_AA058030 [Artemisia annua]
MMEMLPELLTIVAQKHVTFCEDYHSFAGVCKSWRSAALNTYPYSNGPPSRLPSLMLAEKCDDEQEFRDLFLLSNKTIRKIRLPQAYGKLCVSSCGWLLTVGEDYASQLINPLSHETINLPKVDTFPQFLKYSQWDMGISKLILLIPSSLVIVSWGCWGKLGFCHIGDNKWTSAENGWGGKIYDITYYNGQVYSFDCNKNIRACNVNGKDPTLLVEVVTMPDNVYDQEVDGAYIIGLDDNERKRLLVVIREGMFDDIDEDHESCDETYKTKSFQVFDYDLETGKWSKVKDFGTKTLFVGRSSSFWIEDTTGVVKGNCIYYTDDVVDLYRGSTKGGGRDMGIYHLSDGTIEPHFTGESRNLVTPPMWLQSM